MCSFYSLDQAHSQCDCIHAEVDVGESNATSDSVRCRPRAIAALLKHHRFDHQGGGTCSCAEVLGKGGCGVAFWVGQADEMFQGGIER